MTPIDLERATSFGSRAEDYARWRPTYPAAAVDWVLPSHASRVAEVGAGTGALTGSLIGRGLQVDAVEPDARMLEVLMRLHPKATGHLAGAESLPLPDASVDAVLAADAWHWSRSSSRSKKFAGFLGREDGSACYGTS
jgi:ubiquinone/menaquinone biosynthesis C-methylase UbiE